MRTVYDRARLPFFFALALLPLFVLQACGTVGYQNVDTSRKAILVATAELRSANFLLQDLIRRDAIDNENARNALNGIRDAQRALQIAFEATEAGGDPAQVASNLRRADILITALFELLAEFNGEP